MDPLIHILRPDDEAAPPPDEGESPGRVDVNNEPFDSVYNTMCSDLYGRERYGPYTTSTAATAGLLRLLVSATVGYRRDEVTRGVAGWDGWGIVVDHAYVADHPELTEETQARLYSAARYTGPEGDNHVLLDFHYLF